MVLCQETAYGFDFGSLEVNRVSSDDRLGWVVVEAKSPKTTIQIYSTKTGKIRIYRDGVEIK